jgi:hypothetical protein
MIQGVIAASDNFWGFILMKVQKKKSGVPRLLEIAGTKKWLVLAACALGVAATFLQFLPAVLAYQGIMELVRFAGDVTAVNVPYKNIDLFVAHHTVDMVSAAAIPVIVLVVMGFMDWRLMLAALVSMPLGVFIYARQHVSPGSKDAMERYYTGIANLNSTAVEFVNGMPVLKIFHRLPPGQIRNVKTQCVFSKNHPVSDSPRLPKITLSYIIHKEKNLKL